MPKYRKHRAFITGIPLNDLQYLPLESPFIQMIMNCFDCFTGTSQLLYKHTFIVPIISDCTVDKKRCVHVP